MNTPQQMNNPRRALEVYALAACLVALGFMAIYAGIGIYHVLGAAVPQLTVSSWEERYYISDEAYKEHLESNRRAGYSRPIPPDSAIPALRAAAWAEVLHRDRREHLHGLLQAAIGALVALAVYSIHWQISRRARHGTVA